MDTQDDNRAIVEESFSELAAIVQAYRVFLESYSLEQLRYKPFADQWSIGQMYVHLIQTALVLYFPSARRGLTDPDGDGEEKSAAGQEIFDLNGFPPVKIKVADSPAYTPANPEDKLMLELGLQRIMDEAQALVPQLVEGNGGGRALHRRLGALQATEWFRLAEMHFRHHLMQKAELELRLKIM